MAKNGFRHGPGGSCLLLAGALLAGVLLAVSCNLPQETGTGEGSLTVVLPGGSMARSVLPNSMLGALKYNLKFTMNSGGSDPTIVPNVGGTYSINLAEGDWTIDIEARDSGDTLVGTGTEQATIIAGQRNHATILMQVDPVYEAALTEIYIHNEAELRRIGTDFAIDGSITAFYLENDIILSGPWTPLGDGTTPFSATFDGQGHAIAMNSVAFDSAALEKAHAGFFGYAEDALIKDLSLSYPSGGEIALASADSSVYFGGAAGYAIRSEFNGVTVTGSLKVSSQAAGAFSAGGITGANYNGSITACHVKGQVIGTLSTTTTNGYAGGIAGEMQSSSGPAPSIRASSFAGTVNAVNTGGYAYAGGVLGEAFTGSVEGCYAVGNVKAQGYDNAAYSGGIAGKYSSNAMTNSYAFANITADGSGYSYAGGIAGTSYGGAISNCYAAGTVKAIQNDEAYAGGISGEHGNNGQLNNNMVLLDALDGGGMDAYTLFGKASVGYGSNTGNKVWDAVAIIQSGSIYKNDTVNPLSNYAKDTNKDIASFDSAASFKGPSNAGTYAGWDFAAGTGAWKWISGYEYPVLSWQTAAPGDSALDAGFGIIWP